MLHTTYQIPHIIVTSLRLSPTTNDTLPSTTTTPEGHAETLTVIGSTAHADHTPRLFRIDVPAYPVFFSGTGDMFAALMVARLREAVIAAGQDKTARWKAPDDVPAEELPLARAAEKALASMQAVLGKTWEHVRGAMEGAEEDEERKQLGSGEEERADRERKMHLRRTKESEVRLVRNAADLRRPPEVGKYRARAVEVEIKGGGLEDTRVPNEFGVISLGGNGEGAIHVNNDRRWGP